MDKDKFMSAQSRFKKLLGHENEAASPEIDADENKIEDDTKEVPPDEKEVELVSNLYSKTIQKEE